MCLKSAVEELKPAPKQSAELRAGASPGGSGTWHGGVLRQPLAAQRHPAPPAQLPRQPSARGRLGPSLPGCAGPGPAPPGPATRERGRGPRCCRAPGAAGPGSTPDAVPGPSAALPGLCWHPALHSCAWGPTAFGKAGGGLGMCGHFPLGLCSTSGRCPVPNCQQVTTQAEGWAPTGSSLLPPVLGEIKTGAQNALQNTIGKRSRNSECNLWQKAPSHDTSV